MIGKAIFNILNSEPRLAGITKCPLRTPQTIPQPSLVWDITGVEPSNVKNSASTLDEVSFTIIAYSKNYMEMEELSIIARALLDRRCGTFNGIVIQSIEFIEYNDGYDDGAELYYRAIDFIAREERTIVGLFDYNKLNYSALDYN